MKKFFSFILILVFICSANQAFCAKHKKTHKHGKMHGIAEQISFLRYELETLEKGTNKQNIRKIKEWIGVLETRILEKIEQQQGRLEKYGNEFKEIVVLEIEEEDKKEKLERIQSKISSSENKINACQELLHSLDELKSKIKKN